MTTRREEIERNLEAMNEREIEIMEEITYQDEEKGNITTMTLEKGNELRQIAKYKYECGLFGESFKLLTTLIRHHRIFGSEIRIALSFGMLACKIMSRDWNSALDFVSSLLSILNSNTLSNVSSTSLRLVLLCWILFFCSLLEFTIFLFNCY